MNCDTLYIGEDNDVWFESMRSDDDGDYINDATVTFTVTDKDGANIAGAVAIPMTYQGGGTGDYMGVMPHAASVLLSAGEFYTVTVTVNSRQGYRPVKYRADYHRAAC